MYTSRIPHRTSSGRGQGGGSGMRAVKEKEREGGRERERERERERGVGGVGWGRYGCLERHYTCYFVSVLSFKPSFVRFADPHTLRFPVAYWYSRNEVMLARKHNKCLPVILRSCVKHVASNFKI